MTSDSILRTPWMYSNFPLKKSRGDECILSHGIVITSALHQTKLVSKMNKSGKLLALITLTLLDQYQSNTHHKYLSTLPS